MIGSYFFVVVKISDFKRIKQALQKGDTDYLDTERIQKSK